MTAPAAPANTLYRYSGPHSAVTLRVPDAAGPPGALKDQDVTLWRGATAELPDGHEVTALLLARGWISPEPVSATAAPAPALSPAPETDATKPKSK